MQAFSSCARRRLTRTSLSGLSTLICCHHLPRYLIGWPRPLRVIVCPPKSDWYTSDRPERILQVSSQSGVCSCMSMDAGQLGCRCKCSSHVMVFNAQRSESTALALIVADFASRRFRRQNSSMLSPVAGRLPHMNPMSLQFAASMLAAEVF